VRYAQGGGLTDAGTAARERLRLQAVGLFELGEKNGEIATALRVSERSVERWRRAWREQGEAGVLSKGSAVGRGCPGSRLRAWSASWDGDRWLMAARINGGRWPG
jgi:Homeodomain-like domain